MKIKAQNLHDCLNTTIVVTSSRIHSTADLRKIQALFAQRRAFHTMKAVIKFLEALPTQTMGSTSKPQNVILQITTPTTNTKREQTSSKQNFYVTVKRSKNENFSPTT